MWMATRLRCLSPLQWTCLTPQIQTSVIISTNEDLSEYDAELRVVKPDSQGAEGCYFESGTDSFDFTTYAEGQQNHSEAV